MLRMVEWCTNRSKMAVAMTGSPKTWPQSTKPLLEVSARLPRS